MEKLFKPQAQVEQYYHKLARKCHDYDVSVDTFLAPPHQEFYRFFRTLAPGVYLYCYDIHRLFLTNTHELFSACMLFFVGSKNTALFLA